MAGARLQENAAANAKYLYELVPRIKMDIEINAPLIIVPQNSKSNEAILADLGASFFYPRVVSLIMKFNYEMKF